MNSPVRILHVLGGLNMGGAESRIMDLYRNMDRECVQFDFLVHSSPSGCGDGASSEERMELRPGEYFDGEIRALGGRIYAIPKFNGKNYFAYRRAIRRFFGSHGGWGLVEGHMTSTASLYLPEAKKAGACRVTAAHLRSAGVPSGLKGIATGWLRSLLPERADLLWSCSREAGRLIYGEREASSDRFLTVPNAIETKFFSYSEEAGRNMRAEYGIPDPAWVIGHVGRFEEMKNHSFLIGILKKMRQKNPGGDIRLLLVGTGKLQEKIRREASENGLEDSVIFAGQCDRQKTASLYQAMDCFCFPSLYEGVPGTVIEAQAAGLPCLLSKQITEEVCVTSLAEQLPLRDPEKWEEKLCRLYEERTGNRRRTDSVQALEQLDKAGYNAAVLAKDMQRRYAELAGRG